MNTSRCWILALSLVALGVVFADEANVDHFKEGQRLFGEQDFAGALEEFQKADAIVPDDATITSWVGASLNALGRYAEAKQRLETAFRLLQEEQRALAAARQPGRPIALGFYVLLAEVQVNLREFEAAVRTIQSFEIPGDVVDAAPLKQSVDDAKKNVLARLVSAGVQCLHAGELDCARAALTQAQHLNPAPPPVLEAVAKDVLFRAAKHPGSTDEEKAEKAALYRAAIDACRLWLAQAQPASEAQRVLAKALIGSRTPEGYDEAGQILTALWDGAADANPRDASIQLDLSAVYTGLENWELAVAAATAAIENDPDDPLGEGYCKRSYAQYRMNNCQQAVEDGRLCKNADGTPRVLRYVDTCNQRLAVVARAAADRETSVKRECEYLEQTVKWAIESGEISLEDLLKVMRDFEADKAKCAPYFTAATRADTAASLCLAGVGAASSPLNLSARSREQLQELRAQIEDFSSLCKPHLNASQSAGVQGGLQKVDQALSMYR